MLFNNIYLICKYKFSYCVKPDDASPMSFCSNVDLSFQPSPCMFSHQIKLNMGKPGLLILTPKGLSLTFFSECGGKYQHHLLFSPVNSAACLTQPCFRLPHLGQLQILQIPGNYSEIQCLLPCLQLKYSSASLHLMSQLLSFSLSLTNVTFILEICCDCQDCCLSLFF